MYQDFQLLHPVLQTILATIFTWGVTALGASTVFFVRTMSRRFFDGMLGLAAGVMIAASYWSLLAPAIVMSEGKSVPVWFPALVGFMSGGIFLWGVDKILPHLHPNMAIQQAEGVKTTWQRSTLLILAITLHNIPEGLAVGVAFGAAAAGFPAATLPAAIALALGIGLQNFPEGIAVAMPLRREGLPRWKCFWYGQLSAVVEPVAGAFGAGVVLLTLPILPYALAFAAGAMIFVVIEELVPESKRGNNTDLASIGVLIGFAIMMILDVSLG